MKDEEYINPENKVIRNGGKAVSMKNKSSSNKLLHNENINYKSSNTTEDDSFAVDQTNDNIVLVGSKEQQENHNGTQRTTQEQFRNGSRQQKKSYITKKIEINEKRYDYLMNQKEAALKAGQDTSKIDKELENLKSTILSDYKSRSNIPSLNKHIKYEHLTEEQKFLTKNAEREKSFVNYKKQNASIVKGISFASGQTEDEIKEVHYRNGKLTIDKTYEERLNELQKNLNKNKYYKKDKKREGKNGIIKTVAHKTITPYKKSISNVTNVLKTKTLTGRAITKVSSSVSSGVNSVKNWKQRSVNNVKSKIKDSKVGKAFSGVANSRFVKSAKLAFNKFSLILNIIKWIFLVLLLISVVLFMNQETQKEATDPKVDRDLIEYTSWIKTVDEYKNNTEDFYKQYRTMVAPEDLIPLLYYFRDDTLYSKIYEEERENIADEIALKETLNVKNILRYYIGSTEEIKQDINDRAEEFYAEVYEKTIERYLEEKEIDIFTLKELFLKEPKYSYLFYAREWPKNASGAYIWERPYTQYNGKVIDYNSESSAVEENEIDNVASKKAAEIEKELFEEACKHDEYREVEEKYTITIGVNYIHRWKTWEIISEKPETKRVWDTLTQSYITKETGKMLYEYGWKPHQNHEYITKQIKITVYGYRDVVLDEDGKRNQYWTENINDPNLEDDLLNPDRHYIEGLNDDATKIPTSEYDNFVQDKPFELFAPWKPWDIRYSDDSYEANTYEKMNVYPNNPWIRRLRSWNKYTTEEVYVDLIENHNPKLDDNDSEWNIEIVDPKYDPLIVITQNKENIFLDYYNVYDEHSEYFKDNKFSEHFCMRIVKDEAYYKCVEEKENDAIMNNKKTEDSIYKGIDIKDCETIKPKNNCYSELDELLQLKEFFETWTKYAGVIISTPDFTNTLAWRHPGDPVESGSNEAGPYGQCTWFAEGMFYQNYNMTIGKKGGGWGNGNGIVDTILATHPDEFEEGDEPVAGAVFSAGINGKTPYGHTGLVIKVLGNGKYLIISGNMNGTTDPWEIAIQDFNREVVDLGYFEKFGGTYKFANPKGNLNSFSETSKLSSVSVD